MKITLTLLTIFASVLFLGFKGGEQDEALKIFKEKKCSTCHTIKSLNIGKSAEKDDEAEKSDSKVEPPDLSSIGNKLASVDWVKSYMKKKELVEDRKHPKKFKGSDEELNSIANFLVGLKAETKK